ncbi:MAG: hypothetical protein IPI67_05275 [Myxococcales bacterium]|nr:hypothetical protein [Myxococcales bacterium]
MRLSRRGLLSAGVVVVACRSREKQTPEVERAAAPTGSPFSRLTRALGPWPPDARAGFELAESFEKGHPPEPPKGLDFGGLAARCLAERRSHGGIDVGKLSELQREFVLEFAAALYRIPDVYALLTHAPPEGSCATDLLAYTKAPD